MADGSVGLIPGALFILLNKKGTRVLGAWYKKPMFISAYAAAVVVANLDYTRREYLKAQGSTAAQLLI